MNDARTPDGGSAGDPAAASADTLDALLEQRAAQSPDAVYLEDARSDRAVTFAELRELTSAWRSRFDELELRPSAAVLVDLGDPLAFAVVHLAAIAHGLRSLPVDPSAAAGEPARLAGLIRGAGVLVSDGDDDRAIAGVARIRPADAASGGLLPDAVAFPADADPAPTTPADPAEPRDTGSAVLFTSGSTGTPKGVELPEPQLLFVARQVVDDLRLEPGDRGFNSLPLHHVNAEVVALLATLTAGSTLVLDRRFRRTGFWELLAERRVTWLNAVPAILAVLARSGPLAPPATLRLIRCASSPLPDRIREQLDPIPLVLSWGMTEGASQITATDPTPASGAEGVGLPRGSEVVARGDDGAALAAGEVGALWIRGPGVIDGYLFGAAADRFDADGWLRTGDLGAVDADGRVSLVGRDDDVINRGGEKVYPEEVEEVLLQDERVQEAVVIGRPDEVLGAVPVAYVIPAPGVERSESADAELVAALTATAERGLARFRRPVEIAVVADLPRAAAGKVQRSRVRELDAPSGPAAPSGPTGPTAPSAPAGAAG